MEEVREESALGGICTWGKKLHWVVSVLGLG